MEAGFVDHGWSIEEIVGLLFSRRCIETDRYAALHVGTKGDSMKIKNWNSDFAAMDDPNRLDHDLVRRRAVPP